MINYITDDSPLFRKRYAHTSTLLGYYTLEYKKRIEKENYQYHTTCYLFESHHEYYILQREVITKDEIIEINIETKQVPYFILPEQTKGITITFYIMKEKSKENIKNVNIKEIDYYDLIKFSDVESKSNFDCILGEHIFIPLKDNDLENYKTFTLKGDKTTNSYEFAKSVMNQQGLFHYLKTIGKDYYLSSLFENNT